MSHAEAMKKNNEVIQRCTTVSLDPSLKLSHVQALQKYHDVLQRCTTINLYVIDFLRAKDVLNEEQESDLKAETSLLKQRILLYQWLKEVSSEKYESFLQVMKDAEQEHVANLLIGSTEDDHLPLSDARYDRLKDIRHKMAHVTRIDTELIAELRGAKAISMTDAEEMRAETVDYAKVSKLISAIMRRSNYCYNSFQKVLRKTIQTAAADFLSEGVMPELHMNDNRPDLDAQLSHAFNGVIENGTTDDAEINARFREMNGLGLSPVIAIPEQSIVVFIYCKTVQNAANFTRLFISGRLQHILESIFSRLLLTIEPHNTKTLDPLIKLDDKEVAALEEFTGIEGCMGESVTRQKRSVEMISHGCNATTQTDWMPVELKDAKCLSNILYSTETQTESQYDDGSSGYDWASATIERTLSWSSIQSSIGTGITDDDSGIYATNRDFDWKRERQTVHMNLESLLGEEEELLAFFIPEEAAPDPGLNWKQRRTTLNNELPKMLETQTNILESLIKITTSDESRVTAQDIHSRLHQQRLLWTKLKQQVLDEHMEFIRCAFESTFDALIINKIGLPWEDVRKLKRKLIEAKENFNEGLTIMEERIEKHREFLVDRIDPDFGLLDILFGNRILTKDVRRIKLTDNTTEDKNRILLDFVLKNKEANELISALRDSGQTHLVNYLNADGGYKLEFGDDWPLNESEISRLEINRESLIDLLETSDLCIRLFSETVINYRQQNFILTKPADAEKNEALLDMLSKFSRRQYRQTIACLNESKQPYVAALLSDRGGLTVMKERIEKHREFLIERIDPEFGLLDRLLANRSLTREDVRRIKLKYSTSQDKNRILLDIILKNKKANELVSALRGSGQTHLVNYLNADGGYGLAFGDDWPLSENDLRILDINYQSLIDLLDTTDLCIRLFAESVINTRQKQLICSKPTDAEKNEALLDMLIKFSRRQYKQTISCLNDSNQSHIADLLSTEGVLVRVHSNLEGTAGNIDETEDEMIKKFRKVLESHPLDEALQLLDHTKLRIIAAKKGSA